MRAPRGIAVLEAHVARIAVDVPRPQHLREARSWCAPSPGAAHPRSRVGHGRRSGVPNASSKPARDHVFSRPWRLSKESAPSSGDREPINAEKFMTNVLQTAFRAFPCWLIRGPRSCAGRCTRRLLAPGCLVAPRRQALCASELYGVVCRCRGHTRALQTVRGVAFFIVPPVPRLQQRLAACVLRFSAGLTGSMLFHQPCVICASMSRLVALLPWG